MRLGTSPATEALPAGDSSGATMARRREAGAAVVSAADRGVAQVRVCVRPGHADLSRNNLPQSLCSDAWRAEEGAHGALANPKAAAPSKGGHDEEWTRPDRGRSLDP